MLTRKQKETLVQETAAAIKDGKSVTFVGYKGLGANDMVTLKKTLRASKAPIHVIKKSLLSIALVEAGVAEQADRSFLEDQIAFSVSYDDEVTGPKAIAEFAKKNDKVVIMGGVLDGKMLSAADMKALATLPSRDQMRAQLVGTLQAPITGFVRVLSGNLRGLVTALDAIAKQKA